MKLPYKEKVYIPRAKLTKYLFSESHPVGRSKAKFFRKYGFDNNNIQDFEQALHLLIQSNDVKNTVDLPYGINYEIVGII